MRALVLLSGLSFYPSRAFPSPVDVSHVSPRQIDTGSFLNPSSLFKPLFRYWLPDASVDAEVLANDIKQSTAIGSGGIELVGFYEYGGELGVMPVGANWSTFGFGTPAYRHLFKTALQTHLQEGTLMDFILGPNQGQGVPADATNPGLQWDMIPYTAEVPQNGSFEGILPGWADGTLVSLVTASVSSTRNASAQVVGTAGASNITYQEYTLKADSLKRHLQGFDENTGHFKISLPRAPTGTHYRIFAFYERLSGYRNLHFESSRHETIFDNGSYAVDHFDRAGAQVVIDFWQQHMLVDGIPELLHKAGRYAWEDSLELPSNVTWSRTLASRFEKLFGYQLELYMPLITFKQNNLAVQGDSPGSFHCILDTPDQGQGYVNDYRAALVDGYREYLETLGQWVRQTLRLQLSVQPAYGMPMDMQAVIPYVDVPECESLSFVDSVDSYRQFTGPAHLSGKRIISNEMGAVRGSAFSLHIPDLLFSINRALVGGVNRVVIHGQTYSGSYFGTTWPGYTPFRAQYIQQRGVAKTDVAIYNKQSATAFVTVYDQVDLLKKGWSYSYLSPENLLGPHATVQDGVLAPDGPAWKALVVPSSQNITCAALETLALFARRGLPILLAGGLPGEYATGSEGHHADFTSQLQSLVRTENVHQVKAGQVANKLSSLNIRPNVGADVNGTLYTTWREDKTSRYAMLYADLDPLRGSITVQSLAKPYFLDPWTGETFPVAVYQRDNDSTTIPISLSGNQTLFLAFGDASEQRGSIPPVYINTTSASLVEAKVDDDDEDVFVVSFKQSKDVSKVILSNGTDYGVNTANIPEPFQLVDWNLTVEHWEAPDNFSDLAGTFKYNTSHQLDTPTSWTEIPALVNTSGIGFYSTSFEWPPLTELNYSLGAYLHIPNVKDAVIVSINEVSLPPLDPAHAHIDITEHLVNGHNLVQVLVPTTMWNYVRSVIGNLSTAGSQPLPVTLQKHMGAPISERVATGLLSPVTIIPTVSMKLHF
ncbi:Hypothetical protein NCS54_00766100 [Fusarium falciforme]|uniref:Hypothetical protein n=1 Tax=Fusarium falciforme TaxID=195108 RepID=UPI00230133FE|nr:Hypothetical protein NCS54_00766100 [Fusarium falciforme]WAO90241.1 Hypothetical protein NCS54_00766100 [Fusarium falciforme]